MNESSSQRWLHRYAVLTAIVALLPISMGALVTTLGAGMAFLDWPTSDGWFMLTYPWLGDFRSHPDKFVEHGHRLAAVLIGMFTTGLAVWSWKSEPRRWVKWLALSVFLAVVGQGLLGGFRVIQDSRTSALVHGQCASLIFSAICLFVLVTSPRWNLVSRDRLVDFAPSAATRFWVFAAPVVLVGQATVGSFVRHFGLALHEHLGGAIVATVAVISSVVASWQTKQTWLRTASLGLLLSLLLQLTLGAGAWVTKFGFPPAGYVAVQQATEQILFRTTHAVVSMLVLMLSLQVCVRMSRLGWLSHCGCGNNEVLSSGGASRLEPCAMGGLR